jgi:hypothetical protein
VIIFIPAEVLDLHNARIPEYCDRRSFLFQSLHKIWNGGPIRKKDLDRNHTFSAWSPELADGRLAPRPGRPVTLALPFNERPIQVGCFIALLFYDE